MARSGVNLITVEVALGSRPFEVTQPHNPNHIQLRSHHELWFKENALNIGLSRLPADAEYAAVVDADFTFARPDWAQETIQQLQHHEVVQMFNQVCYLDHKENMVLTREGFASRWARGATLMTGKGPVQKKVYKPVYGKPEEASWGPPGGAWAFRRDALNKLGGLIDYCILGSGDYFMAYGMIGKVELSIPHGYSKPFVDRLVHWQQVAQRAIRQNIGVVPGAALHHWHGPMSDRNYSSRESIIVGRQFNPLTDIKKDAQGLWQLEDDHTERFIGLRDDIRAYFRCRNEDAVS